mmetsp:Transcript_1990/g.5038  ORF Transcript_1990/g.5038 Transcript_1990/m.5038 type:complete len:209 (+) Transcript_1990:1262-1888(+)
MFSASRCNWYLTPRHNSVNGSGSSICLQRIGNCGGRGVSNNSFKLSLRITSLEKAAGDQSRCHPRVRSSEPTSPEELNRTSKFSASTSSFSRCSAAWNIEASIESPPSAKTPKTSRSRGSGVPSWNLSASRAVRNSCAPISSTSLLLLPCSHRTTAAKSRKVRGCVASNIQWCFFGEPAALLNFLPQEWAARANKSECCADHAEPTRR